MRLALIGGRAVVHEFLEQLRVLAIVDRQGKWLAHMFFCSSGSCAPETDDQASAPQLTRVLLRPFQFRPIREPERSHGGLASDPSHMFCSQASPPRDEEFDVPLDCLSGR